MPKYQHEDRAADLNDDSTYSEEFAAEHGNDPAENQQPANGEDATFKKRYSDLRRHQQQRDAQHEQEKQELRDQLKEATEQQLRFPKTEEEVKQWADKYPEVAQIVETIAGRAAKEQADTTRQELESIREDTTKAKKERAFNELLNAHPDFLDIKDTQEFHDWISEQPKYIYDALYKNSTDAKAAARAVDLYKSDTGTGTQRSKKDQKQDRESAARGVDTKGGSAPSGSSGRAKFSESQVQAMTDREYEENEDAIMEAMRSGKFNYDVSGAAR